jgi:hypothetical protein
MDQPRIPTRTLAALLGLSAPLLAQAPIASAKVFWVGHSLVDGRDWNDPKSKNLLDHLEGFAASGNKTYAFHRHTIPGAPLGWNWGTTQSWNQVRPQIAPLTDKSHADYGTFDAIVITEGVNIESSYDAWASGFYARKFFAAARNANPNARLFLYESWHHFQAGDFQNYYGPRATFDWRAYMLKARKVWEKIADEAADPAVLAAAPDPWNNRGNYRYAGTGEDPGNTDAVLPVRLVPVGQALVRALDRIAENRPADDWTYARAAKGGRLSGLDFFMNPLRDFPQDLTTTVRTGAMDDIHSSDVLSYLNAAVHYGVLFRQSPVGLPPTEYVPANIAALLQQIAWETVTGDPRTGVTTAGSTGRNPSSRATATERSLRMVQGKLLLEAGTEEIGASVQIASVDGAVAGTFRIAEEGPQSFDLPSAMPGAWVVSVRRVDGTGSSVVRVAR